MTPDTVPSVLLADGRPGTFTDHVLGRTDVTVVLLRVDGGAGLPQDHLDRTAHLPTFTIAPGEPLADAARRYRPWAAALPSPPVHFCNPQEPLQAAVQEFAGRVGLPHLTPQQVAWVREKPAMKQRYAEIGVPHAAHAPVRDHADVLAFAQVHGWPVVVKPRDSFACIDTFRVDGPAALPALTPDRAWTVEEYVRGREFQLCALVHEGKVADAYLSLNPRPVLEVLDGAMNANITYSRSEERPLDPVAICQTLVDGLEIDHGYFHGECFLTDDGRFVMSEVAARISGCEVPENHGRAYGFDVHRAILDTYLGRVPELVYTRDRAVGDLLLPIRAGRVTAVSTWADLAGLPGVTGGRIRPVVGDVLVPQRASHSSTGYVHVEGRDVAQVQERMQGVLDAYVLEVAD